MFNLIKREQLLSRQWIPFFQTVPLLGTYCSHMFLPQCWTFSITSFIAFAGVINSGVILGQVKPGYLVWTSHTEYHKRHILTSSLLKRENLILARILLHRLLLWYFMIFLPSNTWSHGLKATAPQSKENRHIKKFFSCQQSRLIFFINMQNCLDATTSNHHFLLQKVWSITI